MTSSNVALDSMLTGLPQNPPDFVVARCSALLAGDQPMFVDATHESGADIPGTRYTFIAITDAAICYLRAENDCDRWSQERIDFLSRPALLVPTTLIAWRRPLTCVTEIGLGGDPWQWLRQDESGWAPPCYVLTMGQDTVQIPLSGSRNSREAPNPTPVITRLTAIWQASLP